MRLNCIDATAAMQTGIDWLLGVLVILLIILDNRGGSNMPMPRYSLTAFKYNEDTMRPVSMGIHKQAPMLTDAWQIGRDILVLNEDAVFVEVYKGSDKIDTITRANMN